ncbi:hypothetical protein DDV23_08500, partial [Streptococcus chenjunshii]
MATLTDQEIQRIQQKTKSVANNENQTVGDTFDVDITDSSGNIVETQTYEIVNKINGTTEALAVAPINNKVTDYSQTAIVVAGTQLIGKEGFGEEAWNSTKNVIEARSGLTPQVDDISDFYDSTVAKLEKDYGGGSISNMSGFSQSGPAVAKVAAQHQVPKITNFMDWGASSSLYSKDNPKGITAEEKTWLDKHATIYMDSTRDVTYLDGKSHGD